jgi:hypothetical protein
MKVRTTLIAVGALVILAVFYFVGPQEPEGDNTNLALSSGAAADVERAVSLVSADVDNQVTATPTESHAVVAPAAGPDGGVPVGTLVQGDEVDQIARRFSEKVHIGFERSGNPVKEMLVRSGLSSEDSERIAKEFLDGLLTCLLAAAKAEADERSLPYKEVLLAFEEAIDNPEIGEPTILDGDELDRKAEGCASNEMQKAGVSLDVLSQQAAKAAAGSGRN